jgi:uncharacterized membrane protein YkoI
MPKLKAAALAASLLILAACGTNPTAGTASQLTTTDDSTTSATTTSATTPESTTTTPTTTDSTTDDSTTDDSTTDATPPTSTEDNPNRRHDDTPSKTAGDKPKPGGVDHRQIALNRVGGGQVIRAEQELEHGRTEWKYRIVHNGRTYEVRVDAASGIITRFETKK